jgi:hypothetical protein
MYRQSVYNTFAPPAVVHRWLPMEDGALLIRMVDRVVNEIPHPGLLVALVLLGAKLVCHVVSLLPLN